MHIITIKRNTDGAKILASAHVNLTETPAAPVQVSADKLTVLPEQEQFWGKNL